MRRIVHLSDLHFGRADTAMLSPLLRSVARLRPDVVVVSGDLTQRARVAQFKEARTFLDRIQVRKIVIPGNHDVPLNAFDRFLTPLRKFRKYISTDLEPTYFDEEIAIVAINTARSFTTDRGSVGSSQLTRATHRLLSASPATLRVVVTHHPFDLPESVAAKYRIKHAARAMRKLVNAGAEVFLAGHAHLCHAGCSVATFHLAKRNAIIVQAGTGISTRTRGEPNSFNCIEVERQRVRVSSLFWSLERKDYIPGRKSEFERSQEGWIPKAAA